jgi:hypothetical protein
MNTSELLQLFRSEARDAVRPYLWSDTEIFSYMNDAQYMLCRLSGGLADVIEIEYKAGDEFVPIPPQILKLRSAVLASNYRDLEILNLEDANTLFKQDDYGNHGRYRLDNQPGAVYALITGMKANAIRLVQIPEEDDSLRLVVYRAPNVPLTEGLQELEVDERHHRHLLLWMKHLAHMKQDAEAYDRGRSEQASVDFRVYCDQVKREREMTEHKYRTVTYGGY